MTPQDAAYAAVCDRFPVAKPDRRGWTHVACPFCGKEGKHFAFSQTGYRCFVCGQHGGIRHLAEHIGAIDWRPTVAPQPVQIVTPPEAPWLAHGAELVARSLAHPDRLSLWQGYKPVALETMNQHRFGVGRLPFQRDNGQWQLSKADWLTVPLYAGDRLVGLRGRNLGTTGPKWISATGTHYCLWHIGQVRPGRTLWVCENYVDAALLMQSYPDDEAVAIGGATMWKDEYTAQVQAVKPKLVIVALDNDLAGQAQNAMRAQLLAEWQTTHPGLQPPTSGGLKIMAALRAAHVTATLLPWHDAPAKADVGWLLTHAPA